MRADQYPGREASMDLVEMVGVWPAFAVLLALCLIFGILLGRALIIYNEGRREILLRTMRQAQRETMQRVMMNQPLVIERPSIPMPKAAFFVAMVFGIAAVLGAVRLEAELSFWLVIICAMVAFGVGRFVAEFIMARDA